MKIVFATDLYFPVTGGGIQIATRRLAKKLVELGNEVFVITYSDSFKDMIFRDGGVTIFGIRSLPFPFYEYARYMPYYPTKKAVFKILNEIEPDIIHVQTFLSVAKSATLFAKKNNIPLLATGHFIAEAVAYDMKAPKIIAKAVDSIVWEISESIWRNADVVSAPSEWARNYFYRKIGPEKALFSVSNGIDLAKFNGKKSVKGRRPLILFVGRLDPVKRVDTIVKAMSDILKFGDVSLVLVGRGTESERLQTLVRNLGLEKHVSFTGFISEEKVSSFLKSADVFVSGSSFESQGISLLEATASGLPIVATNVGGIPEIVNDGINGYLFEPGDSKSLSQKVIKILSDSELAERMGEASIKIAQKHHIDEVTIKMQSLYQKAIAINQLKVSAIEPRPAHKWLAVKVALAIFLAAVLLRWSFFAPAIAKAKNLRIIKTVQNFDEKLEISLQKREPPPNNY